MSVSRSALKFYYLGNPKYLTRRELLAALNNRKVQMVGGRWVHASGFGRLPKKALLELLEGSKPLTEDDRRLIKFGMHAVTPF